jgi:nucleoside-diphosphate-sugar epimerase
VLKVFIGAATSKKLLAARYQVVVMGNLNEYYDVNLELVRLVLFERYNNIIFIKLDITERVLLGELLKPSSLIKSFI